MLSVSALKSLIQGQQFRDARLYDVLMGIVDRLDKQQVDINTINADLQTALAEVTSPDVDPVTYFTYTIYPTYLSLDWAAPDETIRNYEIRYGSTWETALRVLITSSLNAKLDPVTTGSHTYLIKSIDYNGNYSETAKSLGVEVSTIGSITITTSIVDNNVLFYWSEPESPFEISHYIIKREGVEIGIKDATFTTHFEKIAGTYTYAIIPVDIAGNQGPESSVNVTVSQPPDYVFYEALSAQWNGTLTNCKKETQKLIACIDRTEDFDDHFTSRGWLSPQDQIDAGYPIYIQPCLSTGRYEEVFEFSTIISNVIVNVYWSKEVVTDNVSATCTVFLSTDGVTYDSGTIGNSVFAASVKYVKVRLDFSGDDTSITYFSDLEVRLDVKKELDSGLILADSSDTYGTVVEFNKAFRDVDTITLTVQSTEYRVAIYDFTDVPNPAEFRVQVFDQYGNRTTDYVSWFARGIV